MIDDSVDDRIALSLAVTKYFHPLSMEARSCQKSSITPLPHAIITC